MFYGGKQIQQSEPGTSGRITEAHSQTTILKPRESPLTGSKIVNLISINEYGDFWRSRAEFVFASLLYCLNLGNLWRFPTQTIRYGEGAFLYVYLIFTIIFGTPLLFFEIAIGQYTNKGLMNVFRIVPIFEGISYSMVFLCNTLVHVYDMIEIFNFIYLFSFIRPDAPLSEPKIYTKHCFYENRTNTRENLHFLNEVIMVSDDLDCVFNLRNFCITFTVWLTIWVATSNEYTTKSYFTTVMYTVIISFLSITLIGTLIVNGAIDGIIRLLVPPWSNFLSIQLYCRAFEQSIITLGLGMGPLINFGSYTTFRTPIHIDAVRINIITIIASLIMLFIIYGAIGAYNFENSMIVEDLNGQEYYIHVLLSKLFGKMSYGFKHVNICIFYFAFYAAGFFSSVKYVELMIQLIYSKWDINPEYNSRLIFAYCTCQFFIGGGMMTFHGIKLLHWSATNVYTSLAILTLVSLETAALVFFYKMKHFCDDIEFMLGYKPNWWHKIIWYITPFSCLLSLIGVCFEYSKINVNWYDGFCLIIYFVFIILPLVIHGILTFANAMKRDGLSRIFYPKEVETDFLNYLNWRETASLNSKDI